MTAEERLKLSSELIGFNKLPPTIEEFIESPIYLGSLFGNGKLYPYWKKVLIDIFPDPITQNYNSITLSGCLGSGKESVSYIMSLYTYCKLSHLKNLDFFGMHGGKDLLLYFSSYDEESKHALHQKRLDSLLKNSSYFCEEFKNGSLVKYEFEDASERIKTLGKDIIFSCLEDLDLISEEEVEAKYIMVLNRFLARFRRQMDWFGLIVTVQNPTSYDSPLQSWTELSNSYSLSTKVCSPALWDIFPERFNMEDTFEVFIGDKNNTPSIIKGNHNIPNELTRKVPMCKLPEFREDLQEAFKIYLGLPY